MPKGGFLAYSIPTREFVPMFDGIVSSSRGLVSLQKSATQIKGDMAFVDSPGNENGKWDLSRVRIKALCLSACLFSPVELVGIVEPEVLQSLAE